jgi:hypothetical protein
MMASKEEIFFKKLKFDRAWYMKNFLKIRDKNANLIDFKVNLAQQDFLHQIEKCEKEGKLKRFIILKARQMGFSTFSEGLIFHDTSTNQFKNSLIIAHEDKATQNLFNMSKLFYEELPDVIKPMKKYANEKALVFENPTNDDYEKKKNPGLRSKITVSTANTVEAGRSATVHNLHASEVAFFPDAKKTMLGLLQCVPDTMNTIVILESTANGVGDYFHQQWTRAVKGESDFIPLFYPWFFDPAYTKNFNSETEKEYFQRALSDEEVLLMEKHELTIEQMNWRRWAINNKCQGDEELFRQEYPSTPDEAFIASGRPVFNIPALRKYQQLTRTPERGYLNWVGRKVEFVPDPKGYIHIWEHPKPETYYCIGGDVAEGKIEGDYSVGMVGNEQFGLSAMWHGHIDPDLFGEELTKLAIYYNEAYLGVENNNHGLTTLKAIQRQEYWNIYFSKTYDRMNDQLTQKMGWTTSARTKPLMIDKLAEFIREMYLDIPCDLLVTELFTYVRDERGLTNAQSGCHDDTVMSLAIMLQMLLEGKGENFTPEVVKEGRRNGNKIIDGEEIVDKLFEKDDEVEVSE